MKTLSKSLIAISLLFASHANASDESIEIGKQEMCMLSEFVAEMIITERLNGEYMSTVMKGVDGTPFYEKMVIDAYSRRVPNPDWMKDNLHNEFIDEWAVECYKRFPDDYKETISDIETIEFLREVEKFRQKGEGYIDMIEEVEAENEEDETNEW